MIKILIAIIILSLMANNSLYPSDLIPFFKSGKWGFADKNRNIIIKPRYDRIDLFHDGRAWVSLNELEGFIDSKGNEIIPIKYKTATNFRNGYAVVSIDEKYTIIDTNGAVLMEPAGLYMREFSNGVSVVDTSYKYGLMNLKGEILLPLIYGGYDYLSEELYQFLLVPEGQFMGKNGLVNSKGEIVQDFKYDYFRKASNGMICFKTGDKFGFVDLTGSIIIEPKFDDAKDFLSSGLAPVKSNDKWGLINKYGNFVVEPKYSNIGGDFFFGNYIQFGDVLPYSYAGKQGLLNIKGEEICKPLYSMIGTTSGGITPAYRLVDNNSCLTLIDSTGRELFEPTGKYNNVGMFAEGLIPVGFGNRISSNMGYIDLTGKEIIKLQFEEAGSFRNGKAIVKTKGNTGVIDKKGNYIIKPKYKELNEADNFPGFYYISNGNGKFYISPSGLEFWD